MEKGLNRSNRNRETGQSQDPKNHQHRSHTTSSWLERPPLTTPSGTQHKSCRESTDRSYSFDATLTDVPDLGGCPASRTPGAIPVLVTPLLPISRRAFSPIRDLRPRRERVPLLLYRVLNWTAEDQGRSINNSSSGGRWVSIIPPTSIGGFVR